MQGRSYAAEEPHEPAGFPGSGSVLVIAEAGVNHNGSLDRALALVDAAVAAGADAVKFQTFRADALATPNSSKAAYQAAATGAEETQHAMLKRLELSFEAHHTLRDACRKRGILFLSTAFDEESLDFLVGDLDIGLLKSPSGELTNGPYLLKLAQTGLPVIVSTGLATLDEIGDALDVLAFGYTKAGKPASFAALKGLRASPEGAAALKSKVALLHCTTAYPTPPADVNLRAMGLLADTFGLPVGYSDHTMGTAVSVAATALGARVIEKHFTLDRELPGPDHKASLEPDELARMISEIREVEQALGQAVKGPTASERDNLPIARRALVAARNVKKGEALAGAITAKRPAHGLSPMHVWAIEGLTANRDYAENELLDERLLGSPGS